MGLGLWVISGALAALLARQIPYGRSPQWLAESIITTLAAVMAGLAATALDFGGWKEPAWPAALFALLCAFAAAGLVRVGRLFR